MEGDAGNEVVKREDFDGKKMMCVKKNPIIVVYGILSYQTVSFLGGFLF
jgi:hypothetical protein